MMATGAEIPGEHGRMFPAGPSPYVSSPSPPRCFLAWYSLAISGTGRLFAVRRFNPLRAWWCSGDGAPKHVTCWMRSQVAAEFEPRPGWEICQWCIFPWPFSNMGVWRNLFPFQAGRDPGVDSRSLRGRTAIWTPSPLPAEPYKPVLGENETFVGSGRPFRG